MPRVPAITNSEAPASASCIAKSSKAPDIRCSNIEGTLFLADFWCRHISHAASIVMPNRIKLTSAEIDTQSGITQARAKPSSCATSLKNTRM